eukprot:TRINITY_DN17862_c2_g2_i1.p1 TRINITY_DN17862_c2_g2~~TRINITY_DN17862_c2_g2_i1.p1  ORF type:complete len:1134 (+),score=90.78 TRINITY_DN17862_c2_g2_i1:506-3403(+)
MGYVGEEGMYVSAASREPALRTAPKHLPLEYYRSYNTIFHPQTHEYFDAFEQVKDEPVAACTQHGYFTGGYAERYVAQTGDQDAVETITIEGKQVKAMKCWEGKWQPSLRCREKPDTCIPVVSNPGGWGFFFFVQWAYFFNMSLALAATTSPEQYNALPRNNKILWYWYWPDKTFLDLKPEMVVMPPASAKEHSSGLFRTGTQASILKAWAWPRLKKENPPAWRFLKAFASFDKDDMNSLVYGATPCEWVRANRAKWLSWVPTGCEPGQYDNGAGLCVACPAGKFNENTSALACADCDFGSYSDSIGQTSCAPCLAGEFANQRGLSMCLRCAQGKFSNKGGSKACSDCDGGKGTKGPGARSAAECVCAEGTYEELGDVGACKSCPAKMKCPQASTERSLMSVAAGNGPTIDSLGFAEPYPVVMVGFWTPKDDPLSVYRCTSEAKCIGGAPSSCAEHLVEQSCAYCANGYYWDDVQCAPCASVEKTAVLFPILPAFLTFAIIVFMYKTSGDSFEMWDSWKNRIVCIGFLTLNHYQVLGVTRHVNVNLHYNVQFTFRIWGMTEDLLSIFKLGCAGFGGFKTAMIVKTLAPAYLLLVTLLTWALSHVIASFAKRPQVILDRHRSSNVFLSLMFTFFNGIAALSFSLFKCVPSPNGISTLKTDASVTCFEGDWNSMVVLAIFAVLVYCVGFGAFFGFVIYFAPRKFADRTFQRQYKFLFVKFRPDVHWWAICLVLRGLIFNIGFVAFSSGFAQLYWVMSFEALYLGLTVAFLPWRFRDANALAVFTSLVIFFACAANAMQLERGDDLAGAAALLVVILTMTPILCALVLIARIVNMHVNKNKLAERAKLDWQLLHESAKSFVAINPELGFKLYDNLTDWDAWFLRMFNGVVRAEFLGQSHGNRLISIETLQGVHDACQVQASKAPSMCTNKESCVIEDEGPVLDFAAPDDEYHNMFRASSAELVATGAR